MIIKMNKNAFELLKDDELPRACFDPIIPLIRAKGMNVKEEIYSQLTEGQKALFMYNAYYNHASKSLSEFYWWSAYYFAQPRTWSALLEALHYFQTNELDQLLHEIERYLDARNYPRNLKDFNAAYNDLDHDDDLLADFTAMFTHFNNITLTFQQLIGRNIRNNPLVFIKLNKEKI